MKRAVSISLGHPSRDKTVMINLQGVEISVERIGTGGDADRARHLFLELDGKVDALSMGGMDMYVRLGERDYPVRTAIKLVRGVHQTPLVDGRVLKYVYEKRIPEMLARMLGKELHFEQAFMPFSVDRVGMAEAISTICPQIFFGDLMFMFGLPLPVRGVESLKRAIRLLMPLVGYMPLALLYPPGVKKEEHTPKFTRFWQQADLIVGDLHYIAKYAPGDLQGKFIITNTTTPQNREMLKQRGVGSLVTTSPQYDGRTFGTNVLEAILTAYAGKNRPLQPEELNNLIDELNLQPTIEW